MEWHKGTKEFMSKEEFKLVPKCSFCPSNEIPLKYLNIKIDQWKYQTGVNGSVFGIEHVPTFSQLLLQLE